jgi:hypothetical protein
MARGTRGSVVMAPREEGRGCPVEPARRHIVEVIMGCARWGMREDGPKHANSSPTYSFPFFSFSFTFSFLLSNFFSNFKSGALNFKFGLEFPHDGYAHKNN